MCRAPSLRPLLHLSAQVAPEQLRPTAPPPLAFLVAVLLGLTAANGQAAAPLGGASAPAKLNTAAPAEPAPSTAKIPRPLCAGDTDAPAPLDPTEARLQGVISAPEPLTSKATLELVDHDSSERRILDRFPSCDRSGANQYFYRVDLRPGTYELTLSQPENGPDDTLGTDDESTTVHAGELRTVDLAVPRVTAAREHFLWLIPTLFLLSIWLVRWNNIAAPTRRQLIGALADVHGRLEVAAPGRTSPKVRELVDAARKNLDRAFPVAWWSEWLLWSRGYEVAGWQLVHQAELEFAKTLSPEQVSARMLSALQELADLNTPAANGLSARTLDALTPPKGVSSARQFEVHRQLLIQLLDFLFERNETDFATLTSWQNKAFWLTLVGMLLIVSLAFTEHHTNLFLAGAAGGFLSRMMRQLKRADVPSDYGASWATLFLSPIEGALAGWFGVVVIMLLSDKRVGLVGGPLLAINWSSSLVAPVLGMAFALGFSERFFDGVLSQLNQAIDDREKSSASATGPIPAKPPSVSLFPSGSDDTTNPTDPNHPPDPTDSSHPGARAGTAVTWTVAGKDVQPVQRVTLIAATDQHEVEVTSFHGEGETLTFTVPAKLAPGTYEVMINTGAQTFSADRNLEVVPDP